MSKRKYSIINYIETEDISYNNGEEEGIKLAKTYKKDPTFNFKSYLDGLCNGYTLEFKMIKENSEDIFVLEKHEPIDLILYINNEKISYNKGVKNGRELSKNTNNTFINFKSYLDGICNSYTNYDINATITKKIYNFLGFSNNVDCVSRMPIQINNEDNKLNIN